MRAQNPGPSFLCIGGQGEACQMEPLGRASSALGGWGPCQMEPLSLMGL